MCDEIDCDGCCDGDCCDNNDCCCGATSSTSTMPLEGSGGAATTGGNIDHDCLFYVCCAGCFLCPLFYVGNIKRVDEPIITTIESTRAATPLRNNKDDDTVAATALTSESENLQKLDSVNGGVPSTVMTEHAEIANSVEQNVPVTSSVPMDRK
jgi:hypothetical protein